ncbi:EAL domain-containing protein [Marinobacter sp. F3R08]|uniref:bifunctional diguanylate cyclase/phosphodiesterase n=1 Tax=Marinobacter sp. F3R08 TaxID=2841559 RepID=UPI001C0A54AB|nr:EAL domain-containing protein [Marinobacter sp. F3R08]MBU2955223.1 EAL domain-containing protein [Marinobacter sp. F3R08]
MLLSLKWKAVVFLSLVLILITGIWVIQQVNRTVASYEDRVAEDQTRQQLIIDQLLNDNYLRLSQLAQLITEIPEIQRATDLAALSGLPQRLDDQWVVLNISTGIDYIALYSIAGEPMGNALNQTLFNSPETVQNAVTDVMQASNVAGPQSFIYCSSGCSQFVIEPFVLEDGTEALIVVAQSIADVIQRFQQLSGDDLAVLLPPTQDTAQASLDDRTFEIWGMRLWAASHFQQTLAVLTHAGESVELDQLDSEEALAFRSSRLSFHSLDLNHRRSGGFDPKLITVSDETRQYNTMVDSLKTSLFTGLLALLLSEIALLLLMLGPIKRLISVVNALKLLPQHQYGKALSQIQPDSSRLFPDELSLLEKSTEFVTRELQALHVEVEDKNRSLHDQIAVISRSRGFLERLIDSSQLFIVIQTFDGKILSRNASFKKDFSRPLRDFNELFNSRTSLDQYRSKLSELKSGTRGVMQFDSEFTSDQGLTIYIDWTCCIVEDERGDSVILTTGIDLTQRKRDEEALEWLANNDPLTGIGNRRGFQSHLNKVLDLECQGALIFIDVDRFKQINDLYGHNIGDQVLIQIANSLKTSVRSSDSISRLAGDEFTIILPEIQHDQLLGFLANLSRQLNGQLVIPTRGRTLDYNVSIGAALIPEHGRTEQELIVHADMAMYQTKKNGGGHWQIFDPSSNDLADLRRDHDLSSLLRQALSSDDLFELNFQPILSIKHQSVSHYEVLLRLRDTNGVAVFPNDFIPAAERMGLIQLIDHWVMEKAIQRLANDRQAGHQYSLSVNVSAPTLQSLDFPAKVNELLQNYSLDPSLLIIELTETAYIENFQMALNNLESLSDTGVLVALDDFGVGFSSFSYLKKLPLSYVKLDGSYIQGLPDNPDNQIFVESLTRMVSAFGMKTIAEFVEDAQTLAKLEELGVAYAQGYFIGKPTPDLEKMVKRSEFI